MLGLGNNLTEIGHSIIKDTIPTYSLALDGVGDVVSFPETTYAIDDTGDNGSISFWAKRTDNNDEATILGSEVDGPSVQRLWFDSDGDLLTIMGEQGGQLGYAAVTAATNWRHYVVTWAGQDGGDHAQPIIYEDGVAISTTHGNFGVSDGKDFVVDTIGGSKSPHNTHEFKGLLYQIGIWDVTLGADAVAAIYNSGTPIPLQEDTGNYDNSEDLVTLWRFNEGSGSTTSDSIGSLTGIMEGDATFSTDTPPN